MKISIFGLALVVSLVVHALPAKKTSPIFIDPRKPIEDLLKDPTKKPSVNGIRNVGNGGGLAEMRTIYLHQNLDRFLKICLSPDNTCSLSSATQADWKKIAAAHAIDSAKYIISFKPTLEGTDGFAINGNQLIIASASLYKDLETPKRFGELLAFVVAIRSQIVGSKNSFATNLQIATDVFSKMKVEESSHRATGVPSLLRVSQLKANDGQQLHIMYTIEDKDKTIDITEKINLALPCGDITTWNLNQWNSSIGKTAFFYATANGRCNGVLSQKRIVIQMDVDKNYLIDEKSIEVRFFLN